MNYRKRLLKIKEKYDNISTEYINSIVDKLFTDPDGDIEIEETTNILFDYVGRVKPLKTADGRIIKTLIHHASYDKISKKIIFYLTSDGVDVINNGTSEEREIFRKQFILLYKHEQIHSQQDKEGIPNIKYYDGDSEDWEKHKRYLSQYCEIDAFARSIAQDIENCKTKVSKIFKRLPPRDYEIITDSDREDYKSMVKYNLARYNFDDTVLDTLSDYAIIGGDVWKKLLKRIYEFLPKELQEKEIIYGSF